jgi:hypothetical protein
MQNEQRRLRRALEASENFVPGLERLIADRERRLTLRERDRGVDCDQWLHVYASWYSFVLKYLPLGVIAW